MNAQPEKLNTDQTSVTLLDTNWNGRLEASEYVKAKRLKLLWLEELAKVSPEQISDAVKDNLRATTADTAAAEFATFAKSAATSFPCGVDTPSRYQFDSLTYEARKAGMLISRGHATVAEKVDAAMFLGATDVVNTGAHVLSFVSNALPRLNECKYDRQGRK